jgi:hypothetical protein
MATILGLRSCIIKVFVSELFILSFRGFEMHIEPSSLVSCCKP